MRGKGAGGKSSPLRVMIARCSGNTGSQSSCALPVPTDTSSAGNRMMASDTKGRDETIPMGSAKVCG